MLFVNRISFVVNVAIKIKFTMIEHVPRHKEDILLTTLKKIVNMYTQRGMGSAALIMDSEFECL